MIMAALVRPAPVAADEPRRFDLAALIAAAAEGPRARMAAAATDAERARLRETVGRRYPTLTATGAVAPSPSIACENPDCTVTSSKDITLAFSGVAGRLDADLIQPLFTFGKLDAGRSAASAAVAAARHLEDAQLGDVAVDAARAYYGVLIARELEWMLEDGAEQIDKALARIKAKLAAGAAEVTLQDRFRVEALRAEVGARLVQAREAESLAMAGVHALAGEPAVELADEYLEPVELELGDEAGYAATARRDRPEVRAAAAGAEAARELARLETARWLPDLVLVGGVRVARAQGVDDPPSAFANDPLNRTSAAAALAVQWTFDPVAQTGRADRARAQARRAEALAEAAGLGADYDARQAHIGAARARERLEVARGGETSARAWLASALQADAIGTLEAKELADAYVAYFEARARTLAAMYDWNVAVVRLRRATGEYTQASLGPSR